MSVGAHLRPVRGPRRRRGDRPGRRPADAGAEHRRLVILDIAEEPAGLLTDRDLVLRVLAQGKDPHKTSVGEVIDPGAEDGHEGDAIEQALALMRSGAARPAGRRRRRS